MMSFPTAAFNKPPTYPLARRDESIIDNYFGVEVPDPYRWLENPESKETEEFIEKQVKLTNPVLQDCTLKDPLTKKLTEIYNYPRYSSPFKCGNKYFYSHNTGLQAQDVFYIQDNLDENAEVLLDPNQLSDDGTISLMGFSVSQDANYLAYQISTSGSDWTTIKVMRIEDRKVESDTLSWVKHSNIIWTHDNLGFFYCRFPPPNDEQILDAGTETNLNLNQQLCYHFLGTHQSEDILCWKDPENPRHWFRAQVTNDGKYLLLYTCNGSITQNKLYYLDLATLSNGLEVFRGGKELLPFTKFMDTYHAYYTAIANDDTIFTFLTNKDAPNYKLVRVDLKTPSMWFNVIRESEKDVLESAVVVHKNKLFVCYLSEVKHVLEVRDLETGARLHHLPVDIGSVHDISGTGDGIVFFSFTSFLSPGIIYRCDLKADVPEMKVFKEIVIPKFDHSEFEVDQVFVSSKDGTKIPMFIVARKGISLDGSHPCLLYSYGGFNLSLTPYFQVNRIVLLKHLGAIFCLANIRGGGEYGQEWHLEGSRFKKQNCFDDFISVAEFLISKRYTQPKKLCIEGHSNGGLLVGACINQRPDIFGCALAHVGVMDMLRFHQFTVGHAWTLEYGCSDKEEEFRWLIKYSPVHNVRRPWEYSPDHSSQYPATMLLTADHDDRVVPSHTLKLLATMQYVLYSSLEKSPQTNPIIARIECKAGHGYGRSTQKLIDEAAESYSFMAKVVNASWID